MKTYKYRHQETYKDIKIDVRADNLSELMEKLAEKKKRIDRTTISPNMKLLEFSMMVVETYKQPKVSESWYKDIVSMVNNKIVPGIGNKPVGKIKPLEIEKFLSTLTCYADSHIKKIYDITCFIFKYAYKNGMTPYNYAEDLVLPKGKDGESGRSITDYERKVLLQVIDGHRGELFCKLMLYCGLRPGEVCALQWVDIDFKEECLRVNKALKKTGKVGAPKSKAGTRIVPIPSFFIEELLQKKGSPFELVCPQTNGNYHTKTTRIKMWKNICRLMNIAMGCQVFRNELVPPYPLADDFTMYNLRHTYCTDLEKKGVPINIARRLMGHASIETTSRIYTHSSKESFNIAKDIINGTEKGLGNSIGNNG